MLRNARHLILAALCGILFVLCLAWIGLEGFSWQLAFWPPPGTSGTIWWR